MTGSTAPQPSTRGSATLPPRSAAESRVLLAYVMSHQDTNLYGSVHGGVVMKMIDDAAAAAAGRHAGVPALTVSVESMSFLAPARTGDLLTARAQLVSVGRTSMRLRAVVTAERWNEVGPVVQVASAEVVFVAVDPEGRAHPVAGLVPAPDDWLLAGSTSDDGPAFVPNEEGQRPRRAAGAGPGLRRET